MEILKWYFAFLLVPATLILCMVLTSGISSYRNLSPAEMQVLSINSYVTSNGSRTYLEGVIVGEEDKIVTLNFFEKKVSKLGITMSQVRDSLKSGKLFLPVWYSNGNTVDLRKKGEITPPTFFARYGPTLLVSLCLSLPYFLLFLYQRKKSATLPFVAALVLLTNIACAQNREPNFNFSTAELLPISLSENKVVKTEFLIYPDSTFVRGIFENSSDIKLDMPEYVLEAMMSSTSPEWEQAYFSGEVPRGKNKSAVHYASVQNRKESGACFKLIFKLVIYDQVLQEEYSYIRFRFVNPEKGVNMVGLKRMVKVNGNWFLEVKPIDLGLAFALSSIKVEYLESLLFDRESIPHDDTKIVEGIYTAGFLDLTKLGFQFMLWNQDLSRYGDFIKRITVNPGWQ